ncbi:tripartite tricarboxylate transporter permease [Sabulicella glaciei]|uniref:Tripartite tricarboxylate transporter permease n=1 Tax=Sabulicella glaciei TaxID=2984948 RepID=A0ABT3NT73_9PROT|nr:tripartite tricarboxylate transporter permease [Roseococcus sp. MDT2-1-1]MCW8085362.1 tripartite tricarboxylate transporter permease [Roseococcus sp. MDT2-1-1]
MELLANLALGFETAFSPTNLLYCFIGVFLGTFVGVLPGIGSLATISMLLPLTFHVPPTTALVMLAGIYYGASYGGSTAAILLNLPGTPSAAVACLDGYPMAKKGRAGVALFMTTIASFVGGSLGIIILTLFSPKLAEVGLMFGPADYFAMMLLGLIAAATLTSGSPVKGIVMVLVGLCLGMVGTDVQTGQQRFTFGIPELSDGFSLVALAMGLFGVAEVIGSINRIKDKRSAEDAPKITFRSMVPSGEDWRRSALPMARGTGIGAFFGALPGTGGTIASFMAYAVEKKVAREPSRFGKGAVEGVTAPESANNAAAQTAFIPTLTLGIPGDAVMALMLGAMIIAGVQPGPRLVAEHPEIFWGLVASFWIGNVLLLVLNIPLIGIWVKMLQIPYRILYPAILLFICIGVFSVNNNVFDIYLVLFFGMLGYLLMLLKFEPAPLLLGFILGPLMEEHLRRAMLLSRGDPTVFMERPISASFLAVAAILLLWVAFGLVRGMVRRAPAPSTPVAGA